MKKILLLLIVILIVGCEFLPKESKFSKFSKNTIEFRNNTIVLTSAYSKTSPEEFKSRLDSLENKPKFKKVALHELKKIEDKKVDFELFVDENNVENYVFIYTCDFYQFDEHRAARVVAALNDQLQDESNIQEVKYKRIHGRFFFTPTSKVVKLKYLKAYKKDRKFQTEYIVASKSGGIGLLISNLEDIDFESSIKRFASK
ncbi:hypothetical protein IWQ47_003185 [Aquimarina sp. EL_43]|uniref:hypothetical protein n=1 Tax=Aquimarina TaxID=290174 RepID=UPI000470DBEF|nr:MULTISPECIES: hypothetical protein [Aquimarina]MBG6131496.1 hypothetical protein [Aquimarina sp. EL_35]MBG6151956.1 hypothetical protein [Aquimarina sp. EL_32]MBG6170100.1 hypothetical protein [Aquimarina sp. EL_43]